MRKRLTVFKWVITAVLIGASAGMAFGADLALSVREIRSRIQAMSHGYHSDQEWQDLFEELDEIAEEAVAQKRTDQAVESLLLRAMIHSDIQKNYVAALDVLDEIRERFGQVSTGNMKKVYVREAEVLSTLGDQAAIRALIEEFKESRHYDAEQYRVNGGRGRDVPLRVVRPAGRGSASLTVTTMERYLRAARFAPGRQCPEFETVDREGVSLHLRDYRGQVVLLDFWLSRWAPWRRNLPHLADIYNVYHPYGFEIVGIALESDPTVLDDPWISERAVWRHVVGDRKLPGKFEVYGEASNFLVDQNGVIIARNISGSELVAAIRKALGME